MQHACRLSPQRLTIMSHWTIRMQHSMNCANTHFDEHVGESRSFYRTLFNISFGWVFVYFICAIKWKMICFSADKKKTHETIKDYIASRSNFIVAPNLEKMLVAMLFFFFPLNLVLLFVPVKAHHTKEIARMIIHLEQQ